MFFAHGLILVHLLLTVLVFCLLKFVIKTYCLKFVHIFITPNFDCSKYFRIWKFNLAMHLNSL